MSFELHLPTRVVFGSGAVRRAGALTAELGDRAVVVCGRGSMRRLGVLDRLLEDLRAAGVAAEPFEGVSPDPRSDEVDAAAAMVRELGATVVVGLGGGSAIDAAKAVAVSSHRETVRDLIGATLEPGARALPVVALPTTAGSGAEVTKGSIVTDVVRGLKSGIRGDAVFPRVAIVDPDLTRTLPFEVAAETGFDALTHALEGYLARRASPFTDVLAERALTLLGAALPRLAAGDADDDVRETLGFAALLGGCCVANASTCLPHRLQQAMGGLPRVSVAHGRALAMLYPAWLREVEPFAAARLARAAELLGGDDIHAVVGTLLRDLALDATLSDAGYDAADLDVFLSGVTGNLDNDPIEAIGTELLRGIYVAALPARSPEPR